MRDRICSFCQADVDRKKSIVGGVGRARICDECAFKIARLYQSFNAFGNPTRVDMVEDEPARRNCVRRNCVPEGKENVLDFQGANEVQRAHEDLLREKIVNAARDVCRARLFYSGDFYNVPTEPLNALARLLFVNDEKVTHD
jgi:hypothetical protein